MMIHTRVDTQTYLAETALIALYGEHMLAKCQRLKARGSICDELRRGIELDKIRS